MIRRRFPAALAGLMCAALAGEAPAQQAAGAQPADRFFEEAESWRFAWGTDTAFTASNLEAGSTNEYGDRSTNFDALWMRLYGRLSYGDRALLVVDLYSGDGAAPSVFGLYGQLRPHRLLGVRAGLIPLVVGGWQDRAYPHRQPLINQPLFSQYLLPLRSDSVPADADELLSQSGARGAARYALGAPGRGGAAAIFYEHCWDVGVELFGELGGLRYRAAVMEGSPGVTSLRHRHEKDGRSLEARLVYRPWDALRLGGSWSRGPYLLSAVQAALPPARRLGALRQELVGADARVRAGRLELNGEWVLNAYDSPFVPERLRTHGYYGEAAVELRPGLQAAMRLSGLRFGRIRDAAGARRPWDAGVTRLEAGLVQRFWDDHLALKGVYQRTRVALRPARDERIAAAQLVFSH